MTPVRTHAQVSPEAINAHRAPPPRTLQSAIVESTRLPKSNKPYQSWSWNYPTLRCARTSSRRCRNADAGDNWTAARSGRSSPLYRRWWKTTPKSRPSNRRGPTSCTLKGYWEGRSRSLRNGERRCGGNWRCRRYRRTRSLERRAEEIGNGVSTLWNSWPCFQALQEFRWISRQITSTARKWMLERNNLEVIV